MRYALKEMRSVQKAEAPGSCGLHVGRAPGLQMLASTLHQSCCSLSLFPSAVVAMLGMLSPSSRGALMTTACFLFMFMG